jgi:hypothetical protein
MPDMKKSPRPRNLLEDSPASTKSQNTAHTYVNDDETQGGDETRTTKDGGPYDEDHYYERTQWEIKDQIDVRALQRQLGVAYGANSQEMYDAELKLKVSQEQVSALQDKVVAMQRKIEILMELLVPRISSDRKTFISPFLTKK